MTSYKLADSSLWNDLRQYEIEAKLAFICQNWSKWRAGIFSVLDYGAGFKFDEWGDASEDFSKILVAHGYPRTRIKHIKDMTFVKIEKSSLAAGNYFVITSDNNGRYHHDFIKILDLR